MYPLSNMVILGIYVKFKGVYYIMPEYTNQSVRGNARIYSNGFEQIR